MKRIGLLIILLSVFVNIDFAQELKIFHKLCPSCKEDPNVTMTGYEDELGNIVRHGKLTFESGDTVITASDIGLGDAAKRINEYKKVSMNFANGKLDGSVNAFFTQRGVSLNGEWTATLQYKDGSFVSMDATGAGKDNQAIAKIEQKGNYVVGPFEIITLERKYNRFDTIDYYVGEFDENGLATGRWKILGSGACFYSNGKRLGNELFFHKGHCIGTSMDSKDLAIRYFIEKSIDIEDLHSQGYYIIRDIAIPSGYYRTPTPVNEYMQNMFKFIKTRWEHTLFAFASSSKINMHLEDNVTVSPFKEGIMKVDYSFNMMSEDLYNTVYDNLTQICAVQYDDNYGLVYKTKSATIRYDELLHNYYALKADNVTRLYIPSNRKAEMKNLIDEINVKYFISIGAGYEFDQRTGKYKIQDNDLAPHALYIEDSLVRILDDFIAKDIYDLLKSQVTGEEQYIGLPKRKQNNSDGFVWLINYEDPEHENVFLGRECICYMNTEMLSKPRRISNSFIERWDAACKLSDKNAKVYNTIKTNSRDNYINYRISHGHFTYSKSEGDYFILDSSIKQENGSKIYQMKEHYGERYSANTLIFLTPEEKNRIDNEAYKLCQVVLTDYLITLKKAKPEKVSEHVRDLLPIRDFEILDFSSKLDKGYVIGTFKFTKQVGKKSETETCQAEVQLIPDPTTEKRFKVIESSLKLMK